MSDPLVLHKDLEIQLDQLEKLIARREAIRTGYAFLTTYEQGPRFNTFDTVCDLLAEVIRAKTLEILDALGKRQDA